MDDPDRDRMSDDGERLLAALLSALESALRRLRRLLTSGGAGSPRAPVPAPAPDAVPPSALRALEMLRALVPIAPPSRVAFVGPVAPGTRMREDAVDGRDGQDFVIPRVGRQHFVFYIDDEPDGRFEHATRFAWLELDSGQSRVIPLRGQFTLYPPDRQPEPLREVATWSDGVVVVTFGEGDFAGELRDTSGKRTASTAPADDVRGPDVVDATRPGKVDSPKQQQPGDIPREEIPPRRPPVPPPTCEKIALVCDFGDKDGILYDLADNMAEDADAIDLYLRGAGFATLRRSQYWDNDAPAFEGALRASFLATIRALGARLTAGTAALAGVVCCHEFFLYIASHGNRRGVGIYDADGQGRREFVTFNDILTAIQDSFPDNVVLTMFVDSCGSGGLITEFQMNFAALCRKFAACGVTLLTTTTAQQTTPGGQGIDSATEDFIEGADEDHDSDGRTGDIRDRFNEMRIQRSGYDPQFFHCGPASWGSLD